MHLYYLQMKVVVLMEGENYTSDAAGEWKFENVLPQNVVIRNGSLVVEKAMPENSGVYTCVTENTTLQICELLYLVPQCVYSFQLYTVCHLAVDLKL